MFGANGKATDLFVSYFFIFIPSFLLAMGPSQTQFQVKIQNVFTKNAEIVNAALCLVQSKINLQFKETMIMTVFN